MQHIQDQIDGLRLDLRRVSDRMGSTIGRQKSIQARAGGRGLSAAEQREFDALTATFDEADAEAARIRAQIDALEATPVPRQASPNPLAGAMPGQSRVNGGPARIAPLIDMASAVVPPTYARLFGAAPAPSQDVGFGAFLHALTVGDSATLRSVRNANVSTTGADGGYAVPASWSSLLLNAVAEQSAFLQYCRVLPLTGQSTTFPVINDTSRAVGPGTLTAEAVAEASEATRQTVKFREMTLTARKRMVYWSASSELLQDSAPGTAEAMIQSAASTLAMQIDREIWGGTGVGQMQGVLNSSCAITHAKDGGQSADTLTFTNLSGMTTRLLPSSWNRAIWVIHPSVLSALFGTYLATGSAGGIPAPLTQGADGTYRLFGRPMVITDFAAPLGDAGDVSLVDLSYFAVGFREDLRVEVSREHLFSSDEVAYRVVQRRDGQAILSSAITPARGATTLSPFVILAERA